MTKAQLHSMRLNIQKCIRGIIMDSLCFRLATVFYVILITNPILIESTPLPNMCLTPACIQSAADILRKMDSSVDPCNNFYKFACGQFLNTTYIAPHQTLIDWDNEVIPDFEDKLGLIFQSGITTNDIKPFQQVKQFHRQCMNRTNVIEQQDKIILDILNKLGGWPVIMGDEWNSTNIDWVKLPAMLLNAGYSETSNCFLQLTFTESETNLTNYFIDFSPTDQLRLQQNISFNDPENIEFYNSLVDYAVGLGAEKERAKQELMQSIKFEIELTNISLSARDEVKKNESSLDNFMTIYEMIKKWPTIDWLTYINEIFSVSPDINKANKNETVIINCPSYITKLAKLISLTPKRVLANYALTRVIMKSLKYIDFQGEIIFDKSQSKNDSSAWTACIWKTNDYLPQMVSALYIQKYIKNKTKIETINMTSNIKKELINAIRQVKWLDEQTRNDAMKKIQEMRSKIGYTDIYDNVENITKVFHDFELDGRTHLHNLLSINRFSMINNIRSKRNKVELDNWKYWYTIDELEARYSNDNDYSISPLFLQRPFIDVERPAYMNYGAIGTIIGHEMVHAIDNSGRQFDDKGYERNWWTKSSEENFKNKVDCLLSQYDNYTVEGMNLKINGTFTLDENIADNSGFRLSYLAYKNWSLRYGPEPKLPALDYNPSQMFWITMANLWCSKINKDYISSQIKSDPHSLPEYRILGTISNIPEFSDDFNCPSGSPMNPEKKCKVW